MKDRAIIEQLRRTLQDLCGGISEIVAVYLFGSRAKGQGRRDSDIDLAFLFDRVRFKEDRFEALRVAETLGYEVTRLLRSGVDVAVLNGASLSFACAVVAEAMVLYERDRAERILYEVVLESKYEEFKPFLDDLRDAKLASLRSSAVAGYGSGGADGDPRSDRLAFLLPMAGTRNVLVHGYDRVDDATIFGVIQKRLPELGEFLRQVKVNYLDVAPGG